MSVAHMSLMNTLNPGLIAPICDIQVATNRTRFHRLEISNQNDTKGIGLLVPTDMLSG